ncbi:MAG: lipoyl(octanoyl) transferase LipB [Myxococcota bacterium]|nr:lipoyl(octanoyl) transferase LipB [Myxococcota bacterium]
MLVVERLGRQDYQAAWNRQVEVLEARIRGEAPDTLIVVEHEPVFTVGRNRNATDNLLAPGEVPIIEVERGGDVTFHGPGQVVAYPIIELTEGNRDLHKHLHNLEEAAILTCAQFGLSATRDDRNTGAWVRERKICSVGIACRKWVTWHGLALNVCTDLSFFHRINPCGLQAQLITSMEAELGEPLDLWVVQEALVSNLAAVLSQS